MKKFIFLLFFPLFFFSQNIQWQWAKNVSNALTAGSNNLCAGDNGEFYLTTKLDSAFRIIKFDTGGIELWRMDLSPGAVLNGIAAENGFFCITGSFTNNIMLGNVTLLSAGMSDIFVAKYTSAGNLVWAKRFGGANDDVGNGICNDATGNIYITGKYSINASFDAIQLNDSCNYEMFVAKLNSNGNAVVVKSGTCIGGNSHSEGYRVSVDGLGNIITAGTHSYFNIDTVFIGGGGGYETFYLAKWNPAGNIVFAKQIMTGYINELSDLTITSSNEIITTGNSHWTLGGNTLTEKYDYSGQLLWQKGESGFCGYGANGYSKGTIASGNDAYIIGEIYPGYSNPNCNQPAKFFIKKYDDNGGTLLMDTSNVNSYSQDIIRDSNGYYIVCASLDGSMTLGPYSLMPNLFIAKFKEVSVPSSIKEQEKLNGIKIFPNPGAAIYHLEMNNDGETTVTVFDLLGNSLFTQSSGKSQQQIDLTGYAGGIYLVEVVTGSQKQTMRISHQ